MYLSNDIIKPFNIYIYIFHHITKRTSCHLIASNPQCVRPFTLIYFTIFTVFLITKHQQHAIYFVISTNYLIWFLLDKSRIDSECTSKPMKNENKRWHYCQWLWWNRYGTWKILNFAHCTRSPPFFTLLSTSYHLF